MAFLRIATAACAVIGAALAAPAPAAAGSFQSVSISPGTDLSAYKSVYIAPVQTALEYDSRPYPPTAPRERLVSQSDAAERARDFHDDLAASFGKSFSLASGPGAGVLTVEATVTRLQSSRPTAADLREQPALSPRSLYTGAAAITVVFSEAGARRAEVSDDYEGRFQNQRPATGIWSDANAAFSRWARGLVDFVQKN